MKNNKRTSITLAAATVIGISFVAVDANAQRHSGGYGYGRPVQQSDIVWERHGSTRGNNYSRHYDTLRSDVLNVDRLAQQMNSEFDRTIRYNRRCRESAALLSQLRVYSRSTQNLVRAYNGTCPITFKKAARDVRDTLNRVESQANRVPNISCSMKTAMTQSCQLSSQILRNADRFNPVRMTNGHSHGHHGGNHAHSSRGKSHHETPFVSLLDEIFRLVNN